MLADVAGTWRDVLMPAPKKSKDVQKKVSEKSVSDAIRKRFKIWLSILLILVIGLTVWHLATPAEPLYKGKKLSYLLKDDYQNSSYDTKEAVHHIGTNGIPVLLRLLRAKDSATKVWLVDLLQRQHFFKISYVSPDVGHYGAAYAFGQLGTDASSAVPELIKVVDLNVSPTSRERALESIGHVGLPTEETVAALSRWRTNSDVRVQIWARVGLDRIALRKR